MNGFPKSYKGSAIDFIRSVIIKSLPPVENTIYWSNSTREYLKNSSNVRIVRRFLSFKDRGKIYESGLNSFTVSDNEPALWMYMNSFDEPSETLIQLIDEKKIPISFIKVSSGFFISGKQKREKQFSQKGLKHCHILDCSPKGEDLSTLTLEQRMMRLLSPMNHFPFPSPKKYEMNKDFGEDDDFRLLLIREVLKSYYKTDFQKKQFIRYIVECGGSVIEKEISDIIIEYSPKNIYKDYSISQVDNNRENKNNVVERRNFILSKSFQGKGKIILIKSDSVSIKYNHDDVLDSVEDKITSLPCWEKYGYYTKTQGVPKFINNKFFEYM